MKYLKEAQKLIEDLISKTPTGDLRNDLTDINILLSTGINQIEDAFAPFRKSIEEILEALKK